MRIEILYYRYNCMAWFEICILFFNIGLYTYWFNKTTYFTIRLGSKIYERRWRR